MARWVTARGRLAAATASTKRDKRLGPAVCAQTDDVDPVGWLLGILGGGFVAVVAQHLASRDARQLASESFENARALQRSDRAAQRLTLLNALNEELAANIASLTVARGSRDRAMLSRTAYDAARGIGFPKRASDQLAAAWVAADRYVAGAALIVDGESLGDIVELTTFVRSGFLRADEALRESGFDRELAKAAES